MNIRSLIPLLAVLAVTISACQVPPPEPGPLSAEDMAGIEATFKAAYEYMNADDYASWAALYTEDAVLMPPKHPAVKGRAAIQAFGEEQLVGMTEVSFADLTVEGEGDIAMATSSISIRIAPEGGPEIQDTGKQLVVMRRQSDGSWKAVAVCYNSDLPLPEAPE